MDRSIDTLIDRQVDRAPFGQTKNFIDGCMDPQERVFT